MWGENLAHNYLFGDCTFVASRALIYAYAFIYVYIYIIVRAADE